MNSNIYTYINQLYYYVQVQEQRIQKLEQTVEILRKDMVIVKDKPPVHIERMEYKFDQLKVESLEGTLNIGLNPSDLQDIDDFSIQNKGSTTPYSPKQHMQRGMELENSVYQYLEEELPKIFQDTLSKLNTQVDESYISYIKEDIKRQLPNRIEYYLKEFSQADRKIDSPEELHLKILEQLKKEIQNGVYAFINHLPDKVKGLKQE